MTQLLLLCRSGYESELSAELSHKLAAINIAGYGTFQKGQAWLIYSLFDQQSDVVQSELLISLLGQLIFARQVWQCIGEITYDNTNDRVTPLLAAIEEHANNFQFGSEVLVENPDSKEGNDLARFTRKFTVPLRQALRKKQILADRCSQPRGVQTHVLFTSGHHAYFGVGIKGVSRPELNGITRLKFPPNAPSRSTLKLEDAINSLITAKERNRIFYDGATAVDLGACPGGWTYQLVKRGMHVEAIDNGDIQDELMASGLVTHFCHDGFTYKPQYGKVTLLVCDMIEQPNRVVELMAKWLVQGWAEHAIFNLKLPMKQRYETVSRCLDIITQSLAKKVNDYRISSHHLYHNRDEVTVVVIHSNKDI